MWGKAVGRNDRCNSTPARHSYHQERPGGPSRPRPRTNIELAIFVAIALTFAAAVVLLVARAFSWRRWLAGLAAGATWLIAWYAGVPTWVGALLLVGAASTLWRAHAASPHGGA